MVSLTPVKVRGKRRGTTAEKWNQGDGRRSKFRKDALSLSTLSNASPRFQSQTTTRKRKRSGNELGKIERLPTEIIQSIFEHSGNLSLPSASPALSSQLSDHHVYEVLTNRIMTPVLGACSTSTDQRDMSSADVAAASRLFSCKFMTWPFFRDWLQLVSKRLLHEEIPVCKTSSLDCLKTTWNKLGPPPALLPPRKLLHGPWSDERVSFLIVLALDRPSLFANSPILGETACEGLVEAVAESHAYAVETLLRLGVMPTTELLRQAVMNTGCDREIVLQIIKASHEASKVDFLDPTLWSWANRAQVNGNDNGAWLMALLKQNASGPRIHKSGIKRG
nr:hypothetical protein CFP56_07400 [Quercus suber]